MNTLKSILIGLLIICTSVLYGQTNKITLGLESGPSLRTLRGDNFFEIRDLTTSYSLGVSYQYNFSELLSLRTGISFERKGKKTSSIEYNWMYGSSSEVSYEVNIDYLTIPLLARFTFGDKFKYFVNAGPYIADILIAKGTSTANYTFGDNSTVLTNHYRAIDLGFIAGFGMSYTIKDNFLVSLELRNNFGLLDINSPNYSYEVPTRTFSSILLVGVAYKLADITE